MKQGEAVHVESLSRSPLADIDTGSSRQYSRSIGEILIEAGKLDTAHATLIAEAQRDTGARFGDAAIALKLLTPEDIQYALSRQFEYPYLSQDTRLVSSGLVAAFDPFGKVAEQIRSLRTRVIMHQLRNLPMPRHVAIVSPQRGEGRSFVSANLAIVFSQMGERTLLIDADLRHPVQHTLFKLENRLGFSNVLVGRAHLECVAHVPGFLDLSVMTAGSPPPNPQELLSRPTLGALLRDAGNNYDVVIVDTPPASDSADTQIIASRCGASILVARAHRSNVNDLRRIQAALRDSGAQLIGTVLNGD